MVRAGLSLCDLQPRKVILSDMSEVCPLLTANILLNDLMRGVGSFSNFMAVPQMWGTPLHEEISLLSCAESADVVVVASDVVYDPIGYAPLVHTIQSLLLGESLDRGDGTSSDRAGRIADQVILAQRHRNPEDYKFFDMIRDPLSGLSIEEIAVPSSVKEAEDESSSLNSSSRRTGVKVLKDIKIFTITSTK